MNHVSMLLFLVVTAAPVLMNGPANPSSWSSSSAWSPASTSLRGLPAGTLQAWYDANNTGNKVAFINFALTASGAAGGNVLVTSQNANAYLIAGAQLQLGSDANVYQIISVNNSNLTVQPNLANNYNNALLQVASVVSVVDRSGNGRHLYSATAMNLLAPMMIVFEQVGYFQVGYYPGWVNGQILTGSVWNSATGYLSNLGAFNIGNTGSWPGTLGGETSLIGEIVVTNHALNTNIRQQIEGYLAFKWGLANILPSNHPYANSAPVGFTPASLSPNLMQWYDSNQSSSLFADSGCSQAVSNNNTLACWQDLSGNARHLINGNPNNSPIWADSLLVNQMPVVDMNLNRTNYLSTSSNATWLENTNLTVAMVLSSVSSSYAFPINTYQGGGPNSGIGFGIVNQSNRMLLTVNVPYSGYFYNIAGAPLYNPSSQNGLPGLYYVNNANQSSFSMDGNAASYLNGVPYALAVVAQIPTLALGSSKAALLSTTAPINGYSVDAMVGLFWWSSKQLIVDQYGDDYTVSTVNSPTPAVLWMIQKSAPSTTIVRLNGSLVSGGGGNNYASGVSGYFSLAQYTNTNVIGLTGNIFETIVLTGNLKTAHLTMLEGYLAWKWGLQSQLPQNHPYRLVPPRK